MISIVLPTYDEARSIQEALRRASAALRKAREAHELIVVDDSSPDGTADLAEALAGEIPVRVLRRRGRRGLATAVVDGWGMAQGDVLGVMDADLQHPPEVLARLASALGDPAVDVAIASRSGPGGGAAEEWSWARRLTAWTARHLAACVLPRTLAEVSDPMSGMFLVRSAALRGVRLEPTGYKILLEVLGKAHYRALVEVPFVFQARNVGSSKLGWRESLQYLAHLGRLAGATGQLRSWGRYAAVGLSGALVNVGLLVILAERLEWPLGAALAAAISGALVNNFFWNWLFTFRKVGSAAGTDDSRFEISDLKSEIQQPGAESQGPGTEIRAGLGMGPGRPGRAGVLLRFLHYGRACTTGVVLNAGATLLLYWLGARLPVASAAGVMLAGGWNIFFNVPTIWRSWDSPSPPGPRGVMKPVRLATDRLDN
jgi:dolichol-phosphate mannosyltransferase